MEPALMLAREIDRGKQRQVRRQTSPQHGGIAAHQFQAAGGPAQVEVNPEQAALADAKAVILGQ